MAPSRKSPARTRWENVPPKQVRLFDSPVRQEIVDTLESLGGEADVAAVAAQLGRPADGLYYHFELLRKGGLLERVGEESRGRRYRVGAAKGTKLKLDYATSRRDVGRVIDRTLQIARRDFHAALDDAGVVVEGEARELWAGRAKGWVDARGLAEINRALSRIQEVLAGPRRGGRDRLVSVAFVLAPVRVKPARRGGR